MKKITILFAIATILTNNCYSQDKGYIALSAGSSTPIRDFASINPNNASAGYADGGAIVDLSLGYKFGKNFGLAVLLRGQANPIDNQAIEREFAQQNPGMYTSVDSEPWSIGGFMIGGYGSFPISKRFSFESKAMFGFLTSASPEIKINFSMPGNSGWVKQNSSSTSTFAYLLGVGFKYDVARRICLLANFDYLAAKPEFSNVEYYSSNGSRDRNTFSQTFGTINFSLGLGFRL